jgi:hypothetical protein
LKIVYEQLKAGWLIKGHIDRNRLIEALGVTLSYFPLFCGSLVKAKNRSEAWRMNLIQQPIQLHIYHGNSHNMMPREGVIQDDSDWKWSPPTLDVERIRRAIQPNCLFTMGLTYLGDIGWSIIAFTGSHLLGLFFSYSNMY